MATFDDLSVRFSHAMNALQIWEYRYAPPQYRIHFNDDDCDYIAWMPLSSDHALKSLVDNTIFGCCDVETKLIGDGILYAGYHA